MKASIVYVVDDDDAVRDSLSLLCRTAGLAVECHDSAESFLSAYQWQQPGCLILDVRMGGMSGTELHAELSRRAIELPVIYLTAYGDIPMTVRAIKAGAMDFLTKPVDGTVLLDRVQAALEDSVERLRRHHLRLEQCRSLSALTPREREVMMLALAGLPNKSIARQLSISHRTVEIHRSRLLQKSGTTSMLELAQLVAECRINADGLAEPTSPVASLPNS